MSSDLFGLGGIGKGYLREKAADVAGNHKLAMGLVTKNKARRALRCRILGCVIRNLIIRA